MPEDRSTWTGANDYAYVFDLLRTTEEHILRSQALLASAVELLARLTTGSSGLSDDTPTNLTG